MSICCSYVCGEARAHGSVYGSTKGIGKVREYLYLQYHNICTWTPTVHVCHGVHQATRHPSFPSFSQNHPHSIPSVHVTVLCLTFHSHGVVCAGSSSRKPVSVTFATCVGVLFQYCSGSCNLPVLIVTLHSARC